MFDCLSSAEDGDVILFFMWLCPFCVCSAWAPGGLFFCIMTLMVSGSLIACLPLSIVEVGGRSEKRLGSLSQSFLC